MTELPVRQPIRVFILARVRLYEEGFAAGNVAVALGWRRGQLTMDFVDDGRPFDPLAFPGPDLDAPPEQRPIGGLGIPIVRALVNEARYWREGHRNHLHLVRRLALP